MRKIKQAMILAAGLGSRMGELTKDIPKPMVLVDKIPLIERILKYLELNGIEKVVINTHYKADILENFINSLPQAKKLEIYFSREKELLGTGGGVKNALHFFENKPFFLLNSDSIFIDTDLNNTAFSQLELSWNPNFVSMLKLVARKEKAFGYWDKGDYNLGIDGKLNRDNENLDFVNTGMYIIDHRLFEDYHERILQFPIVFKDLMNKGRLYGIIYDGNWYHIGDAKAYNDFSGF